MERLGVDVHRLGTGLLVFGLIGLVLAGIVTIGLLAGGASVRSMEGSFDDDRQAAVEAMSTVSLALGHAAQGAANLGTTLETTQTTLASTGRTLDTFAQTSDALASGLGFSVLGQQPLAGAAGRFSELAGQLRAFSSTASALATDLGRNQQDLAAVTDDLRAIQTQVDKLATRVQDLGDSRLVDLLGWAILLLAALAAWVAVAGALCAWVGWRLRRPVVVTATPLGPADGA